MPARLSRRTFLALSSMLPAAFFTRAFAANSIPVGLELYSVRDELQRDPQATVRAVAKMGFQCVEFYGPYYAWTHDQAKQMRKLLDDLGIRCNSTHNDAANFSPDKLEHARDLNLILGSTYIVQASAGEHLDLDGWKKVADTLNAAATRLEPDNLKVGYHNHQPEFTPIQGTRPIEIIAKNTKPSVMLQLDVGTCLNSGGDPAAWIRSNPGRIRSIHLKDWSSDSAKGYQVLFGEGDAKWKEIFAAAESVGGVEYYLLEQEGSRFGELETAKRCLEAYHKIHA